MKAKNYKCECGNIVLSYEGKRFQCSECDRWMNPISQGQLEHEQRIIKANQKIGGNVLYD